MKIVGNEFYLTEDEKNTLEKALQILMDIGDNYDAEKFNDCFFKSESADTYTNVVDACDNLDMFLVVYDHWRN